MSAVVEAPLKMVETVAALRLPVKSDQRLQALMDRNTNGALTVQKRDLEALLELGETLALVRAEALHPLGRQPSGPRRLRSRGQRCKSMGRLAECLMSRRPNVLNKGGLAVRSPFGLSCASTVMGIDCAIDSVDKHTKKAHVQLTGQHGFPWNSVKTAGPATVPGR